MAGEIDEVDAELDRGDEADRARDDERRTQPVVELPRRPQQGDEEADPRRRAQRLGGGQQRDIGFAETRRQDEVARPCRSRQRGDDQPDVAAVRRPLRDDADRERGEADRGDQMAKKTDVGQLHGSPFNPARTLADGARPG